MSAIPGWFSATDAWMFTTLSELQRELHVSGDILEIGVFKGRSAILLGHLLIAEERLVLCDTFEDPVTSRGTVTDSTPWYGGNSLKGFLATYRSHHQQPPTVYCCPSSQLYHQESRRAFRFLHIDGSHQYDDVRSDIELSAGLLRDGGVVVLDDYRSLHTPGVAAASWEAVVADGLKPICLTQDKMYAAWEWNGAAADDLFRALLDAVPQTTVIDAIIHGHNVPILLPHDQYRPGERSVGVRITKALLPPIVADLPLRLRTALMAVIDRHATG